MTRETIHIIALRSCALDQIIKYFEPIDFHHSKNDLFSLMRCCKNVHKLMLKHFLKIVAYPFTIVSKWNTDINYRYHRNNIRCIYINDNYKNLRHLNMFPKLTHMVFGTYFNEILKKEYFPDNLTELTFGRDFNQVINKNVLPTRLKRLTFRKKFNCAIKKDALPVGLEQLTFGDNFNFEIKKGILPENLKYLKFGINYYYTLTKDIIPKNLEHLFVYVYHYLYFGKYKVNASSIENIIKDIKDMIEGMNGTIIEGYSCGCSYVCFSKKYI